MNNIIKCGYFSFFFIGLIAKFGIKDFFLYSLFSVETVFILGFCINSILGDIYLYYNLLKLTIINEEPT